MSLEDKLEPKDNIIDKIDNSILSLNKKMAEVWQNKTYKSKKELVTYLYSAGSLSFLGSSGLHAIVSKYSNAIACNVLSFGLGALAYRNHYTPTTGLEDEILSKANIRKSRLVKAFDAVAYTAALGIVSAGLIHLGIGLYKGDAQEIVDSSKNTLAGLGSLCLFTAIYMNRVDAGKPPKKT